MNLLAKFSVAASAQDGKVSPKKRKRSTISDETSCKFPRMYSETVCIAPVCIWISSNASYIKYYAYISLDSARAGIYFIFNV